MVLSRGRFYPTLCRQSSRQTRGKPATVCFPCPQTQPSRPKLGRQRAKTTSSHRYFFTFVSSLARTGRVCDDGSLRVHSPP